MHWHVCHSTIPQHTQGLSHSRPFNVGRNPSRAAPAGAATQRTHSGIENHLACMPGGRYTAPLPCSTNIPSVHTNSTPCMYSWISADISDPDGNCFKRPVELEMSERSSDGIYLPPTSAGEHAVGMLFCLVLRHCCCCSVFLQQQHLQTRVCMPWLWL